METDIQSSENIPRFLNSQAFISARFKEISALKNLINESNRVTSIFQRLPKHMRRRAMSHTVKRVPRNLRDAHRRQLEKNKALKTQKRSRKHFRKRPLNLLLEYNRRQKDNLWLETHVWHAKRFRIVSKWGYRLAYASCDKTFRASYRATSTHCLLQDISYLSCIEITGSQQILLDGLKHVTSSECGLTIGAKCWLGGDREGKVTMFHKDSYPHNAIGDVTFIWRPVNPDFTDSESRTLWIWCHPSFYKELRQELTDLFDLDYSPVLEDVQMKNQSEIPPEKKTRKSKKQSGNVEQIKIALKNIPKLPHYINKESNVRLTLLKDTLNRFRLTGPLSNAILTNALHPAEVFDKYLHNSPKSTWWKEYRSKTTDSTALKTLEEFNSPSYFPPHAIIGANVIDPRLFLKRNRFKATGKNQVSEPCAVLPPFASKSSIWEGHIRNEASLNKFSSAQINTLRSKLLISGHDEQLLRTVNTVVPLLFVQRAGSADSNLKLSYGSGWDIIIPANWAMPVWLSLILSGAKPGALRESKTLNFESKKMPELTPDSKAGLEYYHEITTIDRDRYFRMPPNKRTNYIKNGFPTPFHYPWDTLVNEWTSTPTQTSFYVLRNKQVLLNLKSHFENIKNRPKLNMENELASVFHDKCLVPVSLHMLNKGKLAPFSHICLPKHTDLLNKAQLQFSGLLEKKHSDPNKRKRILFRKEHSKLLKRLRRQRIKKAKSSIKPLPLKITKRKHSPTEQVVREYLTEIKDLWIPPTCNTVRTHCGREICGFIVNSGFSFMESRITGQGYVTLQSLCILNELWQTLKCDATVLTRSSNSLNYRYALLKVCL